MDEVVVTLASQAEYQVNGETWTATGGKYYTNGSEYKSFDDLKAMRARELGYTPGTPDYNEYMDSNEL